MLKKIQIIHSGTVNFFNHLNIFLLFSLVSLVSLREEISTLSRQASFRRMNSVSTDTRGVVLLLNYSFHTEHTVALQQHLVFSARPDSGCETLTPLIKFS